MGDCVVFLPFLLLKCQFSFPEKFEYRFEQIAANPEHGTSCKKVFILKKKTGHFNEFVYFGSIAVVITFRIKDGVFPCNHTDVRVVFKHCNCLFDCTV